MSNALVFMALLAGTAADGPNNLPDWQAFGDRNAIVFTDAFAKVIAALPAPEKAAALQRLQGELKSDDVEVRRRASLTLAGLGDKSGVPTMINDLSTSTGSDRNNVVVALRILKDERTIPALRQALKDESPYVRGIAVAALGELKAVKTFDEVVALTKDKAGLNHGRDKTPLNCIPDCPALSACYALGALGDDRAIPVLIDLLADTDLRRSARQALESLTQQKLGDDPEQWKAWRKAKGL